MVSARGDEQAREQARQRLEARRARLQADERGGSSNRGGAASSGERAGRPARPQRSASSSDGGSRSSRPRSERRPAPAPASRGGSVSRGTRRSVSSAPSLNPRPLILLALILIALIAVITFAVKSCSADDQNPAGNDPQAEQGENANGGEGTVPEGPTPDEAVLAGILDDDDAVAKLLERAEADPDVYWIASHPEEYAVDGDAVQRKLLKLVAMEPEATAFVRNWPESYPQTEGEPCTEAVQSGTVPLLLQWDQRWGYTVYSSTTFALTGCCPTSLAMVYQGLTGKNDLTPYDLGVRAKEQGYMTDYNGTDARFLVNEASALGLTCNEIPADADELREAFADGAVLIANVGPGDFTEGGHFIVLTGLDAQGNVIVNDPFSAERSAKTWPISTVVDQSYSFFAYYA